MVAGGGTRPANADRRTHSRRTYPRSATDCGGITFQNCELPNGIDVSGAQSAFAVGKRVQRRVPQRKRRKCSGRHRLESQSLVGNLHDNRQHDGCVCALVMSGTDRRKIAVSHATFNAPGQRAIQADRLRVAGTVRFIGNFRARGQIKDDRCPNRGIRGPYRRAVNRSIQGRHRPYAPPRGTRAGAGTEGCSTGLLPRPRSCQSWSDSFRFQTSQFRVAPTDALIQNPPSTRGRSLAGRHHGSDDVRIQDQRPSARSARCTAAWAS